MTSFFYGARLKVERARQHIDELNTALAAHLERGAGELRVKQEAQYDYRLVFEAEPVPAAVALILGDAVHNLRTALDHLAWELVEASGRKPGKDTYFPIRETREKLINAVDKGEMKFAGPEVRHLVIDTIQPYKGGNGALWPLHDTDIIDKHRLLVPVVAITQTPLMSIRTAEGGGILNFRIEVPAGGSQNIFRSPTMFKVTTEGKPTFSVFFPEDSGFGAEPVIPTLHQLSEVVMGVIDSIERAFSQKS
jgi:hypothetical protein